MFHFATVCADSHVNSPLLELLTITTTTTITSLSPSNRLRHAACLSETRSCNSDLSMVYKHALKYVDVNLLSESMEPSLKFISEAELTPPSWLFSRASDLMRDSASVQSIAAVDGAARRSSASRVNRRSNRQALCSRALRRTAKQCPCRSHP